MSVVEQRDVYEDAGVRTETRVESTRVVVSPGQIIAGVLGVIVAIIGVITLARGGIDGTMNVPIVRAGGFDQSAMLGAIELGLGLLLVLGALSYAARGLVVFVGVVMILGGVLIGAAGPKILNDLGTVHSTGWAIMVGGIIAVIAGSLGRLVRTRNTVTTR